MTVRAAINPELLNWACERARADHQELEQKFPKLDQWKTGQAQPTLKQLEKFAKFVRAPIGYFFLSKPPEEPLPVLDFRTVGGIRPARPSPELIDTVYHCQSQQDWYRDYALLEGEEPLPFVGSVQPGDDVETVADRIRNELGFGFEERKALGTWNDALRHFITKVEAIGVLVMLSGVVRNNPHRRLDPQEFRGFALSDEIAPLIFINGADTKAAQMFTLAHELAHIWIGQSALSDSGPEYHPEHRIEGWCNQVAAELLVPKEILRKQLLENRKLDSALTHLTKLFKVSRLVMIRRIYDLGKLTRKDFQEAYTNELMQAKIKSRQGGGNFYNTLMSRLGKRFVSAVIFDTLGGRTLSRDAFQLLDISKTDTFNKLAERLGTERDVLA